MKITMRDGREMSGTALQIVQQMRALAFGADGYTIAQYVAFVADHTLRFEGTSIEPSGESDEDLAASLIGELARVGLVATA